MPHIGLSQVAPRIKRGQERILFIAKKTVIRWWAVAIVACALIVACVPDRAEAQGTPIVVMVQVLPPYSPDLSVWQANPQRVLITLQNTDASHSYTIRLSGVLQNDDGSVTIRTKDNYPVSPITIGPSATLSYNGSQLSLFDVNSIQFSGTSSSDVQRTHRLPEGTYSLCIRALDFSSLNPLSAANPSGCTTFSIQYVEPPHPISPTCSTSVTVVNPQLVLFQWEPANPPPISVQYVFTMIEVIPLNRDPNQAFQSATTPTFFQQTIIGTTTLTYTSANPTLQNGHEYAWRIQAVDPTSTAFFRNNGYSEVCSFIYGDTTSGGGSGGGSGSAGGMTFQGVYPANGDTIPWLPPHLVVRFQPYSDSITEMNYTVHVSGSDGSSYSSNRDLTWPSGPRLGQGWPDTTYNNRSTYIVADQEYSGGLAVQSPWAANLKRGVQYTWYTEATFQYHGSPVSITTPSRTFYIGATPPHLTSPSNGSTIDTGSQPVTLNWQNNRPAQLNPPDLLGIGSGGSSMFFGVTQEKWKLELSKDSTLPGGDTSYTGNITSYHTGDSAEDQYASHSQTLSHLDTGKYFWRVAWENPDSTLYVKSDIWSFRIGSGDTTHHDTTHHDTTAHADTGACADNCSAPAPTNTTASTRTFHVGDTITVGKFHMILTIVSGSGSSLTGEGTIQVPYLHAPVEVTFSGISVNTDNQMYGSGKIDAKQASASPISAATANNLSGPLGLDTTQIQTISNLAGQAGRLVSALTMSSPIDLPLGFDDTISGNHYVIAIVGMEWSATDANLNAAMAFAIPDLGPGVGLGLGAKDICFHPDGIGGNGKATLYLAEDLGYVDTNSNSWGFVFKAPTTGDSGTYISFDCHGFKELRLAADIQFPRSWFTPVPENGNHVFGHLRATITKAGDWIAGATLDDCAIAGAPGFTLQVQNMVFDHSDVQNPPGMTFPHGFSGDTGLTWHGFYIQTAKITLPPELTTFDSSHPPTISVNNLMIGSGGFCANIRALNIIHYPTGNFGQWGASIDTIGVDFVSSSLTQGFISGQIKIPISDSSLIYRATLSHPGGDTIHFEFVIQPKDTINCNLWLATLHLDPSSRIQLDNDSGSFRAFANLSGSITLNGNIGSIPMSFIGVDFTNFKVMTTSPYIDIGNWSFASDQHSTDGFPVSISNIGMVTGTRSGGAFGVGVQFTLTVNFTSGGDGIGGAATMSIWGKLATGGGPMSFQFDGVDLDSIGVNADLGAVEIDGGVRIYHTDPTFGDGFRGNLHANFLHEVDIYATAQFGNVNGYRYWYVDARALFATGIPIFTGVGFYGFGGGAWYHMRRQTVTDPPAPTSTAVASSTTPGATVSGYTFVPDQTTELGLRAMITLGTYPTPDAFNADVFFEVSFLSGGGVGEISIGGNGYMMASVADRSSAPVTASVLMTYDFPASTFHGVFTVSINAGPFTGGGQIVFHVEPSTWYIHIGEMDPPDRVHLSLANWINIDAYLMAGDSIPPPPPLPPEVASRLPGFSIYRDPEITTGNGLAFGASASINTGKQYFLIFYGQLDAGIGFDISLLNYGPGTTCEGISGTIGVNGWYAQGQMYAWLNGSIGLHVDLWFVSGDFEILSIGAAAALAAGAPNPTWVKGAVEGDYSILNGLVSGHCEFDFAIGSECHPVPENPLARINLISDIQPNGNNIDVFVQPQAAFNFSIGQQFDLTETADDGSQTVRTFRVQVRNAAMTKTNDGSSVDGDWYLQNPTTQGTFSAHDMLLPHTQYTFALEAYGEELISGVWGPALKKDGTQIVQDTSTTFTTGEAPDHIPDENVAYTYPLNRQRYYLQGECNDGIVQLKHGQPNLFAPKTGYDVTFYARYIPTFGGDTIKTPFVYDDGSRTITYTVPHPSVRLGGGGKGLSSSKALMPAPALANNTVYGIQFIRKEVRQSSSVGLLSSMFLENGRNYSQAVLATTTLHTIYSSGSANAVVHQHSLPATQVGLGEKLLYLIYFKTSQYNTLQDKVNAWGSLSTVAPPPSGNMQLLYPTYSIGENLDQYDMNGYSYDFEGAKQILPLVIPDGDKRIDEWNTAFTNPSVYDQYNYFRYRSYWVWGGAPLDMFTALSLARQLTVYNSAPDATLSDDELGPHALLWSMLASSSALHISFGGLLTGSGGGGGGSSTSSSIMTGGGSRRSSMLGVITTSNTSSLTSLSHITRTALTTLLTPSVQVKYQQGSVAAVDFWNLQNSASQLLSLPWPFSDAINSTDRSRLQNILTESYVPIYNNKRYSLSFAYLFCQDPDSPLEEYSKPFDYGTPPPTLIRKNSIRIH